MKDSADKNTLDAFADAPLGWGGKRPGAGRKTSGIETKVIRVPVDSLPDIQRLLSGEYSATASEQKKETPQTTQVVAMRAIMENWRGASAGKEHQPRWQHVCRLLAELQAALGDSSGD